MGRVVYVGCSQSANAVIGAHAQEAALFSPNYKTGGGSLDRWHRFIGRIGDNYWSRFVEHFLENSEAELVWWQVCVASRPVDLSMVAAVSQEIDVLSGGLPKYISPLAVFEDDSLCDKQDVAASQSLVNDAVESGFGLRGPILPQVPPNWLDGVVDGVCTLTNPKTGGNACCHVKDEGQAAFGQALVDFFSQPPPA